MTKKHQSSLYTEGQKPDGEKATIYYSKPYDILNEADRTELMPFMLLLACVQNKIVRKLPWRQRKTGMEVKMHQFIS